MIGVNCKPDLHHLQAEKVETTFVVSRFSDIQKEMTSFLVVPKKTNQEWRSFSVGSEKYTTRNDQKWPETNQLMVESWGRLNEKRLSSDAK